MEYPVIMNAVWETTNLPGKAWRQIYKALNLLEHLIKHGNDRVVDDARVHLIRIQTLRDFSVFVEGADKGIGGTHTCRPLAGWRLPHAYACVLSL